MLDLPAWGENGHTTLTSRIYDMSSDDEFTRLLDDLPVDIAALIRPRMREVEEVVLALGQPLEVAYQNLRIAYDRVTTSQDLMRLDAGGSFRADGRRGMDGTLHRISRFTDTSGDPALGQGGKTNLIKIRVARVLAGLAEPMRDMLTNLSSGLLIIGPPGVGKTTLLRDAIRILEERFAGSLLVIDTSLEICGEGDVPHPFLRLAKRLMVGHPARQKAVIDLAVMNGGARMMVFDEIGYRDDVELVVFAAQRGVIPIGSVHGYSITNVISTPRLRPLLGLRTDGTVNTAEHPSFGTALEILGKGVYRLYPSLPDAIQRLQAGQLPSFVDLRHTPA